MKKILATLFIAATLLTACTEKEENGNNNNQNQEPTTVSLAGTSWKGTVTNDPAEFDPQGDVLIISAEYRITFTDNENGVVSYLMTTLYGEGDTPEENTEDYTTEMTYTFDGTANGTMTIEGETTPFRYNATDNTIVITLEYNPELDVTEIVLHRS
ncbi:MAG: hypothetical protein IJK84_03095 [Bacteroidales bacterium]|nr:hypothetical protein [Bacteroidales bacterium]